MEQSILATQIVDAIQQVIGLGPHALHEPWFAGNEWNYLKECIDSTYVSSVGKFVDRFEIDLATYTGSKYAVAVVNGTSALHIALQLAGVQSGEEVLIPALTFVATANAVSYCRAIPHFVESEERTLGIDANALRDYLLLISERTNGLCINRITGRIIRAVVPVHVLGHPINIDELLSVAYDFNLTIVEDAAESLGSTYHGMHTGTFGLLSTLSFNGNKTVTTGGGGAILTNNHDIARKAKHLTTTAKIPHRWDFVHDEIAYNYRMPNLNAALGCAQLERLPDLLSAKRRLFERYREGFIHIPNIQILSEPEGCCSNYWLQALLLDEKVLSQRDDILTATNDVGLMTRPLWTLIHKLVPYKTCPKMDLVVAESLERRVINLPSSSHLL